MDCNEKADDEDDVDDDDDTFEQCFSTASSALLKIEIVRNKFVSSCAPSFSASSCKKSINASCVRTHNGEDDDCGSSFVSTSLEPVP